MRNYTIEIAYGDNTTTSTLQRQAHSHTITVEGGFALLSLYVESENGVERSAADLVFGPSATVLVDWDEVEESIDLTDNGTV